jgi:hypothetical protein
MAAAPPWTLDAPEGKAEAPDWGSSIAGPDGSRTGPLVQGQDTGGQELWPGLVKGTALAKV